LAAAGCGRIFEDRGLSGAAPRRPALDAALAALGPGDVLVVWKLARLGRPLPHLLAPVARLQARGAGFRSLTEAMDTTTPGEVAALFNIHRSPRWRALKRGY